MLIGHDLGPDESPFDVGVDDPGRANRGGAFADRPGLDLVASHGEEGDEPHHAVGRGDKAVQGRAFDAEVEAELAGFLFGQLADFLLQAGRQSDDGRSLLFSPSRERRQDLDFAADIIFVQVDGGDERLLGQETEPPQQHFFIGLELGPAKRGLGFEKNFAFLQGGQFTDVAVALLGRHLLDQAFDPVFHDGQVAEQEFGLQGPQVAKGVHGIQGMGNGRVYEGAHHRQQGVGGP